jgi:hypothetical protein
MTMIRSTRLFVAPALVTALLTACGGGGDSTFHDEQKAPEYGGGAGSFQSGPLGTSDACVTSLAGAALTPVNLVFMYDSSGSMGNADDGFDPALKWQPVSTGMKAFFADPISHSLNASLQFFPLGGDLTSVCGYDYATPSVPLTPLTNPAPFFSAIDAKAPKGGTPTLPALTGAIHYASRVAQERKEKAAVVLVTDGEPGFFDNGAVQPGCANNTVAAVALAARTAAAATPPVPTYVIGVGPALEKLEAVAAAGGTGQAFMISVSDPAATKERFLSALGSIRTQSMSCDLAMPPPPPGQELDAKAVNVVRTNGAGQESVLEYSADCASGSGWHYDDLGSPKRILLCASTCSGAQAEPESKLTLAFGCKTKGIVVR